MTGDVTTPHDLSPKELAAEALAAMLMAIDRELSRKARTVAEQRVYAALVANIETIGERLKNEAADRYNVYPIRSNNRGWSKHLNPRDRLDAERLAQMEMGEVISEAAGRVIDAHKKGRLYG